MTTGKLYDKLSFFYPIIDFSLRAQKKKLVKTVNALPKGKVLEIGIGTGAHIPKYRKHNIVGIDISEKSIAVSEKRKRKTYVKVYVMDGENLCFENESFHYVVISHVIAVTKDPEKMISESYRVLKENGLLLILNHETPSDNWLKYTDAFFHLFSRFLKLSVHFRLKNIQALKSFRVMREEYIGRFKYFKLLSLRKKSIPFENFKTQEEIVFQAEPKNRLQVQPNH